MNMTEDQVLAEQEALLAECKLYKGEKEPETKEAKVEEYETAVVDGLPVGPASTVLGAPVGRSPWSTGLFSCFGNCSEHFTSDLQVCEYTSPYNFSYTTQNLHQPRRYTCDSLGLLLYAIWLSLFYKAINK